jgi:hypothetical protein
MRLNIKDPSTFTQQRIFDYVVAMLAQQGGPSTEGLNLCAYRGDYNRKCAIGHLIPDEVYQPDMDGRGIEGGGSMLIFLTDFPELKHLDLFGSLLRDLQKAHDESVLRCAAWMRERLRYVAKVYGLKSAMVGTLVVWEMKFSL